MKKSIYLTLLLCLAFLITSSEILLSQPSEIFEKVKSEKIAFLTDKLSLTEEEAQKFWPIYNQYEKEKTEIIKNMSLPRAKKIESMTEAEANKTLESMVDYREKELQIEKKYIAKFKTVLPIKKVAGLMIAEREFRKVMIDNVKSRLKRRAD
jgi:Spy/CpxP family protein refolding chaperone